MIRFTLGLILFTLSALNHSSLYLNEYSYGLKVKRIVLYNAILFILIVLQGLTGLITISPIQTAFDREIRLAHTFVIFSAILLLGIVININVLYKIRVNYGISLRREGFEAIMYVLVINLVVFHVHTAIPRLLVIIVVSILSIIMAIVTVFLWKYARDISNLVEYVDLMNTGKLFTFTCMLFGCAGMVCDLYRGMLCGILLVSLVSLIITYLYMLKELFVKYIKPMIKKIR